MLSREWVNGTAIGTQPTATTYTPYPWLYEHNLAPVAAAGLRYRLTESNDYLVGVPGASDLERLRNFLPVRELKDEAGAKDLPYVEDDLYDRRRQASCVSAD